MTMDYICKRHERKPTIIHVEKSAPHFKHTDNGVTGQRKPNKADLTHEERHLPGCSGVPLFLF